MSQTVILVVEDDADLRAALCDTLALTGYKIQTASDGRAAMEVLQCQSIDMVITDIQMPGMDGHELLKKIKTQWPDIPVMLMTAYGSIQMAVEAMRDGAVDYLSKPFEAEVLVAMVNQYVGERDADISNMIAEDPRSRELVVLAKRVADSDATIMLMGESGVGKEVLAHYIHNHSLRAGKPFVAINCAAIPENMLEATMFGYEKGAFTGAYKSCPGKFELAQGGTLLLDEISEMDAALQAKLLRVLQEREVERLGGQKPTALDVRVLATSNRNMRQEVKEGRFREDLFYRLNVFPIQIPALRDRAEDILPLCSMLIRKHLKPNSRKLSELSKPACEKLLSHQWPGNVRELDNVIQRSLILKQGNVIDAADIQFENISASTADKTDDSEDGSRTLGSEMKDHEYTKILAALRADNGHRQRAAERLGISQRTLRYKLARMREMGMSVPGRYGMEAV
ncbi:MAG: sigma-54 dependent transcriptional regulator [Gammaproteobacteria bacterium]|nr:sigma-54 dependent transcriptional regulator [Gammaproteobacteria bacterium]